MPKLVGIDDGVTTEDLEALEFAQGEISVGERDIVPVDIGVHAQFADDLDRDRLLGDGEFVRVARAFP